MGERARVINEGIEKGDGKTTKSLSYIIAPQSVSASVQLCGLEQVP